jgi:uncharacterized protein (TIGR02145 family)
MIVSFNGEVSMIHFKVLLAGLACVSLSMADISGIVTDTGSTPISGAVVQLEVGGQKTTTDSSGSFTLKVTTTALPATGTLLPNGFTGRIAGNKLKVTLARRSVVEVATFNLVGKALSIVHTALNAGNHSLQLPRQGAGMYLYKVTSGNDGVVLKGNAAFGMASGTPVTGEGSHPAKRAKTTAAFDDVIAVTKTGYLNYRVVAYNSDTSGVEIKMLERYGTMTDADGNEYQTVKIGKQEWMAENLRTTKYNDGSEIPLVTDDTAWYCAPSGFIIDSCLITTPAYCYYDNTTDADSIRKYGALYNWYVVSPENPEKIAPTGWHVPDNADWDTLKNYLIANGYNWEGETSDDWIAKALAAKTDWRMHTYTGAIGNGLTKNNSSGFSALPGGCRSYDGAFAAIGTYGYWWSTSEWWYELHYTGHSLGRQGAADADLSNALSVRLLRN